MKQWSGFWPLLATAPPQSGPSFHAQLLRGGARCHWGQWRRRPCRLIRRETRSITPTYLPVTPEAALTGRLPHLVWWNQDNHTGVLSLRWHTTDTRGPDISAAQERHAYRAGQNKASNVSSGSHTSAWHQKILCCKGPWKYGCFLQFIDPLPLYIAELFLSYLPKGLP